MWLIGFNSKHIFWLKSIFDVIRLRVCGLMKLGVSRPMQIKCGLTPPLLATGSTRESGGDAGMLVAGVHSEHILCLDVPQLMRDVSQLNSQGRPASTRGVAPVSTSGLPA